MMHTYKRTKRKSEYGDRKKNKYDEEKEKKGEIEEVFIKREPEKKKDRKTRRYDT